MVASRERGDKIGLQNEEGAMKIFRIAGLALALALPAVPCGAAEAVNLILNWTPTADHSPFLSLIHI